MAWKSACWEYNMESAGQICSICKCMYICKYSTTAQDASLPFSRRTSFPYKRQSAGVVVVLVTDIIPSHRHNDTRFMACKSFACKSTSEQTKVECLLSIVSNMKLQTRTGWKHHELILAYHLTCPPDCLYWGKWETQSVWCLESRVQVWWGAVEGAGAV